MFRNVDCTIPIGQPRQTNKSVNKFIKSILDEDRRVKQVRLQEIQSTAENPRIKADNETLEISKELKQQKQEAILEEKRRQQLRENSQDLRQLLTQIQAAHVSQELAEQKAQHDRFKQQQLQIKRREDAEIEKERLRSKEQLKIQEEEDRRKKDTLRGVLLGQMTEMQVKRQQEYQEIRKDKEEMKKVLDKIEVEKAHEWENAIKRREQAKKEMHDFLISQKLFKEQQHQQKVDDNEAFLQFMNQRDAEQKRRDDKKKSELLRKQECSEKIGKQLYHLENEKRKRENLLLDLLVEERKAKEDQRFRQNAEKQYMEQTYARVELERYREDQRLLMLKRQKDEERLTKEHQLRYMADEDNKMKQAEEKKRQRIESYRQALLQLIDDQKRQRIQNSTEVLQDFEIISKEQQKRDEHIERERIRILKQLPKDVLRYLPSGVLRETDREILGLLPFQEKKQCLPRS